MRQLGGLVSISYISLITKDFVRGVLKNRFSKPMNLCYYTFKITITLIYRVLFPQLKPDVAAADYI